MSVGFPSIIAWEFDYVHPNAFSFPQSHKLGNGSMFYFNAHGCRFAPQGWKLTTGCRFRWSRMLLLITLITGIDPTGRCAESGSPTREKVEALIRKHAERLGIRREIGVSIISGNSRLASVESVSAEEGSYRISFEEDFLQTLDDRDLNAVVAHELGHVWIFTHSPYLQTESLANRQALKLVSRADLLRVYEKVWQWNGARGDLSRVIEPIAEPDSGSEPK
jgi:Zn-dependent protease with chaperone function